MKTRIPILLCFIVLAITQKSFGQAEVQAWGNLNGIRVQGELMAFESNLYLAGAKGSPVAITGREMQSPKFKREGASQIVTTKLGNIDFTETVTDLETGKAEVKINYT